MTSFDLPVPSGYSLIRPLQNGFYGPSCILRDNDQEKSYFCKYINKKLIGDSKDLERFIKHIETVRSLANNFIIAFERIIDQNDHLLLLRQFIEGMNLTTYITEGVQPNQNLIFAQWKILVRTIRYLHINNVYPTFIKPGNIFMGPDKMIMITDIIPPPFRFDPAIHKTEPFDVGFLAPEYFVSAEPPSIFSDVWSLGVILWFMIMKNLPWNIKNIAAMLKQIQNVSPEQIELPCDIKSIIDSIFTRAPHERPTTDSLLSQKPGRVGTPFNKKALNVIGSPRMRESNDILPKSKIDPQITEVPLTKASIQVRRRIVRNSDSNDNITCK